MIVHVDEGVLGALYRMLWNHQGRFRIVLLDRHRLGQRQAAGQESCQIDFHGACDYLTKRISDVGFRISAALAPVRAELKPSEIRHPKSEILSYLLPSLVFSLCSRRRSGSESSRPSALRVISNAIE